MRLFFVLLYYICSFIPAVSAKITEIHEMRQILSSIEAEAWVLFDVDATLIEPEISLNSAKWISYYWKIASEWAPDQKTHLESLMHELTELIPVKALEPDIPEMIADLQRNEIAVLALTARPFNEKTLTEAQLKSVQIDFSQTKRFPELNEGMTTFDSGAFFTSGLLKGEYLKLIMECVKKRPVKVVFVDDKLKQVTSVDHALHELGIPCDCFWYRRAEIVHPLYSPLLAIIQLDFLLNHHVILSDEEAHALKMNYSEITHEEYLIQLITEYKGMSCID